MGIRRMFAHAALAAVAGATLTVGAVRAQQYTRTDDELTTMLQTRDDAGIGQYLTLSFSEVMAVAQKAFPARIDKENADEASVFSIPRFKPHKDGSPVRVNEIAIKKELHPKYGNPVGLLHPGIFDIGSSSDRFYLSDIVERAIPSYERDFDHLRDISHERGIADDDFLRVYQLDFLPPLLGDKEVGGEDFKRISIKQNLGAITQLYIDLRNRAYPAARVLFTFQPEGKEPLSCAALIPYTARENGREFRPDRTRLDCLLDGRWERILTTWDENMITVAQYDEQQRSLGSARSARARGGGGGGFCGADCLSPGAATDAFGVSEPTSGWMPPPN